MRKSPLCLGLVFIGVLIGCGDSPSKETTTTSIEEETRARVEQLIQLSKDRTQEGTITLLDGSQATYPQRIPRASEWIEGVWVPPDKLVWETPGAIVETFPVNEPENWPLSILIDDSATVLWADSHTVTIQPIDESKTEEWTYSATNLQWGRSGEELFLGGPSGARVYDWPSRKRVVDLPQFRESGYLYLAPDGESIWMQTEQITFDLSRAEQIRTEVLNFDFEGSKIGEINLPLPLAKVGTLPLIGKAWGHPRILYQLDPTPAPILLMDGKANFDSFLTEDESWVDHQVSANAEGKVLFVRTRSRGGASGRLIETTIDNSDLATLTAETTYDGVISPNGEWLLTFVRREDEGVLVRSRPNDLQARDLKEVIAAREDFESRADQVLSQLMADFATSPMGESLIETEFGPQSQWPPEIGELKVMNQLLRKLMREVMGIEFSPGLAALGEMDDFLNELDGLWPEHPATIMALAGFYGEIIESQGDDIWWSLENSLPYLSYDMNEVTVGDDALFSLHTPFLVARERLAGRLALSAVAERVLVDWERPLILVENFTQPTVRDVVRKIRAEAGLPQDENGEFFNGEAVLRHNSDNDLAMVAVWNQAMDMDDIALATASALELVENNPTDGPSFVRAAKSLMRLGLQDAALEMFQRAEELSPANPDVLLDVALGYFDLNMFDEAEPRFVYLATYDTGAISEVAAQNVTMVREMREKYSDEKSGS